MMTWHSIPLGIGGLLSHLMFLGDSAPEATFAVEKSPTISAPQFRRYEPCLAGFLPWEVSLLKSHKVASFVRRVFNALTSFGRFSSFDVIC